MAEDRRRIKLDTYQLRLLDKFIADSCELAPPVSVRNVYYQAISHFLGGRLPKTLGEYERISAKLVDLRATGTVPYEYVTEGGRIFQPTDTSPSSPWHAADIYPLVVVESVSLQGVLQATCDKYRVGLSASSGQPSATFLNKLGKHLDVVDRPAIILFIGDFDAPGYNIYDNYDNNLAEHTRTSYEVVRVGITREQIDRFSLPRNPLKASHPLREDIPFNVESEAMSPLDLRSELEAAILEYATPEMLERAAEYEFAEQYHYEYCQQVLEDVLDYIRRDGTSLSWLRSILE